MRTPMHENPIFNGMCSTQLELTVRNHPGVMSHICGLFARRAFNVEGILCMPLGNGEQSRIWLLLKDDRRLDRMIVQLSKLEDVLAVRRSMNDSNVFLHLRELMKITGPLGDAVSCRTGFSASNEQESYD